MSGYADDEAGGLKGRELQDAANDIVSRDSRRRTET